MVGSDPPELPSISEACQAVVYLHRSFSQGRYDPGVASAYNEKERLTLLGSALLGASVTKYLYKRFPAAKVGFLSLSGIFRPSCSSHFNWAKCDFITDPPHQLALRATDLQLRLYVDPSLAVDNLVSAQAELFQAYVGAIGLDRGQDVLDAFIEALLDSDPDSNFSAPGHEPLPRVGRPNETYARQDGGPSMDYLRQPSPSAPLDADSEPSRQPSTIKFRTEGTPRIDLISSFTQSSRSDSQNSGIVYNTKSMIPLGASSPSSSMEPSRDFPFREQSPLTTTRLPPPQLPPLPVGKSETPMSSGSFQPFSPLQITQTLQNLKSDPRASSALFTYSPSTSSSSLPGTYNYPYYNPYTPPALAFTALAPPSYAGLNLPYSGGKTKVKQPISKTALAQFNEIATQKGEAFEWDFHASGYEHERSWEVILRTIGGKVIARASDTTRQKAKNRAAIDALATLGWPFPT